MTAARVHHAARRRGSVAARGAGAAARADAAYRGALGARHGRSGSTARLAAFQQGLQRIGLDRWPQCADRLSLGRRQCRAPSQVRGGIGRARRRTSSLTQWQPAVALLPSGNAHCADRVRQVVDPVGAGFVDSLARPGGNVTGLLSSNTASAGSGWSCSSRLRRA